MKKLLLIALITFLLLSCESDVSSLESLEDAAILEPRSELAFELGYKQAVLDMYDYNNYEEELFRKRLREFRELLKK